MKSKQEIIRTLYEKDYMNKLHNNITEGIVGNLRNEYFMRNPTANLDAEITASPIFRALARMLVSSFLSIALEKLTDIILDEVLTSKSN